MHPLLIRLLCIIYPIEDTHLKRDRPLQVLAVGLSRSGTDSLRHALLDLGYFEVYHGFRMAEKTDHALQWVRLGHAQSTGDNNFLCAEQFDRVFGDCSAVTDINCAAYAHELIKAYPNAKVIINYRDDIDAWHTSCINSIEKVTKGRPWFEKVLDFFDSRRFWTQRRHWAIWFRFVNDDFPRNGKAWYRRHYDSLYKSLPEGTYLKWKVEDGWEPLCKFLDKPVPSYEFPHGNPPADFLQTVTALHAQMDKGARRNLGLTIGVLVSGVAVLAGYFAYGSASL